MATRILITIFVSAVFPYPVPPIEENVLDEGKLLKPWDTKKVSMQGSRPKSCEVPGIKYVSRNF